MTHAAEIHRPRPLHQGLQDPGEEHLREVQALRAILLKNGQLGETCHQVQLCMDPHYTTTFHANCVQGSGDTEKKQRDSYLDEVRRQLGFAHAHYLMPECLEGCPCYTPARKIVVTNNEFKKLDHPLGFPPELHCTIITYLGTKSFIAYTSTCRALYALSQLDKYKPHFKHRRQKKLFIPYTEKQEARFEKLKSEWEQVIEDVGLYAHTHHTCHNEGANATRTRDLPKDKTFPSTSVSRATLTRVKFNEGVGHTKELIHQALGLAPNPLQLALWKHLDKRRASDKKRRATDVFKARTIANYKRKANLAKAEKAMSKKQGDEYRAASSIRAKMAQSEPPQKKVHTETHHNTPMHVPDADYTCQAKKNPLPPITIEGPLTERLVNKMKGAQVDAELTARGLVRMYLKRGDLADKRRRLLLFVSDPGANQHLLRQPGGRPCKPVVVSINDTSVKVF